MTRELVVGIADFKAAKEGMKLTTIGLGSCIGVIIYHRRKPLAALGHFMLPDSNSARKGQPIKPAKYGDTCIEAIVNELKKNGCHTADLEAKAAGGASMFKRIGNSTPMMDISTRNIESLKENLKLFGIPLRAEDTGGSRGRTITFDVDSRELLVKVVDPGNQGSEKYQITII